MEVEMSIYIIICHCICVCNPQKFKTSGKCLNPVQYILHFLWVKKWLYLLQPNTSKKAKAFPVEKKLFSLSMAHSLCVKSRSSNCIHLMYLGVSHLLPCYEFEWLVPWSVSYETSGSSNTCINEEACKRKPLVSSRLPAPK